MNFEHTNNKHKQGSPKWLTSSVGHLHNLQCCQIKVWLPFDNFSKCLSKFHRSRLYVKWPVAKWSPYQSSLSIHILTVSYLDYSERGAPSHVARLVVGQHNEADTDTEHRDTTDTSDKRNKIERSNSRVSKVSNLIKWPKKEKDKSAAMYMSDTSQV